MMVAWFMHDRPLPPTFLQVVTMTLIVMVPAAMIAEQPDLGTAMLVIAAGGLAILLAGISVRVILASVLLAAGAVPVLWHYMRDYQRARVFMFLNPESDPLGAGYNTIQAKIAIGSGGLFGKGWMNGTQAHLEFLPERSTDFIFAVMGEEFGLLGLLLLLVLYLALVGRGLWIASQAQDTFTRLLAGTLVAHVLLLRVRERGHGVRALADRRRAAAARERGRHVDGDPARRLRYARRDWRPPEASRAMNGAQPTTTASTGSRSATRARPVARGLLVALGALAFSVLAHADDKANVEKARTAFLDKMVAEHGFDRAALTAALRSATIDPAILDAISRPAERVVPWYEYRAIFVNEARIAAGTRFWTEHAATIQTISERYGVAPEMLVAIVGVETYFGQRTGKYRVLDSLATLAFAYPPRAKFFSGELEQFLLLTREEGLDPEDAARLLRGRHGRGPVHPVELQDLRGRRGRRRQARHLERLGRRARQHRKLLQEERLADRRARCRSGDALGGVERARAEQRARARGNRGLAREAGLRIHDERVRPTRRRPRSRSRRTAAARSSGSDITTFA